MGKDWLNNGIGGVRISLSERNRGDSWLASTGAGVMSDSLSLTDASAVCTGRAGVAGVAGKDALGKGGKSLAVSLNPSLSLTNVGGVGAASVEVMDESALGDGVEEIVDFASRTIDECGCVRFLPRCLEEAFDFSSNATFDALRWRRRSKRISAVMATPSPPIAAHKSPSAKNSAPWPQSRFNEAVKMWLGSSKMTSKAN